MISRAQFDVAVLLAEAVDGLLSDQRVEENVLLALDEALDRLPCREDGRWRWYGEWGCRLAYRFPALRWWKYED